MNDPASPLDPAPAASQLSLEALAVDQQALRRALHLTLFLFLILTGSLFIFFLREVSIARRQVSELTQVVVDYEKNAVPAMEDFRAKLQAFSRAHPDFMPIYIKYFGSSNSPSLQTGGSNRAQPMQNGARLPTARP